jgi:hypothetical protein
VNATKNTVKAPAMSKEEYDELPEAAKYFIPWERAREPQTIKRVKPKIRYAVYFRAQKAGGR